MPRKLNSERKTKSRERVDMWTETIDLFRQVAMDTDKSLVQVMHDAAVMITLETHKHKR